VLDRGSRCRKSGNPAPPTAADAMVCLLKILIPARFRSKNT